MPQLTLGYYSLIYYQYIEPRLQFMYSRGKGKEAELDTRLNVFISKKQHNIPMYENTDSFHRHAPFDRMLCNACGCS